MNIKNFKITKLALLSKLCLTSGIVLLSACNDSSSSNSDNPPSPITLEVSQTIDIARNKMEAIVTTSDNVVSVKADNEELILKNEADGKKNWSYKLAANVIEERQDINMIAVEKNIIATNDKGNEESISAKLINVEPMFNHQWYLYNTGYQYDNELLAPQKGFDLNVVEAWNTKVGDKDYLSGKGVNVLVVDAIVDNKHEELSDNRIEITIESPTAEQEELLSYYNKEHTLDYFLKDDGHMHGNAVTGIILAAKNNKGTIGIANEAKYGSLEMEVEDYDIKNFADLIKDKTKFDVINMSIGGSYTVWDNDTLGNTAPLTELPIVKAIGNEFSISQNLPNSNENYKPLCSQLDVTCSSGQLDNTEREPSTINVAAANDTPTITSYSTNSSAVWTSAYGGGESSSEGLYAAIKAPNTSFSCEEISNQEIINELSQQNQKIENCKYTSFMNGTSSATPEVSGIVSLMTEAWRLQNPNINDLTRNQILYILAKASRNNSQITSLEPSTDENMTVSLPYFENNITYEITKGWQDIGNNLKFSNEYGFGLVDAKKAIDLTLNCNNDSDCSKRANVDKIIKYDTADIECEESIDEETKFFKYTCTFDNLRYDDGTIVKELKDGSQIEHVLLNFDSMKFISDEEGLDSKLQSKYPSNYQEIKEICKVGKEDFNLDTEDENEDDSQLDEVLTGKQDYKHSLYQVKLLNDNTDTESILKPYFSAYAPTSEIYYNYQDLPNIGHRTNAFYLNKVNSDTTWAVEITTMCPLDITTEGESLEENLKLEIGAFEP